MGIVQVGFWFLYANANFGRARNQNQRGHFSRGVCVWGGGRGVCGGMGVWGGGEGMRKDAWETTVQFHLFQTR